MDYKNIKFRAWHKEQNKMFEVLVLDMNSGEVFLDGFTVSTVYKGATQEESTWVSVDEVELMMYIGIQDKHGKDIYEGDIVSYTEINGYKWQAYRNTRNLVTEVTVSIKTEFEEYYSGEDTEISYENIEIIGNKYENPELLQS